MGRHCRQWKAAWVGFSVAGLDLLCLAHVEPLSFRELLKSAPFWLVTVAQFASATTIFTLVQWIPSYLTTFRHVPFKDMGRWITIGYILATVLTLLVGYLADRTMQRALAGAWVSVAFVLLIIPAQMLSTTGSAVLLSTLIFVASSNGALNGALMHTMVRPEAIARGTGVYAGIGMLSSAIGPWLFGMLISTLAGQYWGGFAFLLLIRQSARDSHRSYLSEGFRPHAWMNRCDTTSVSGSPR